MVQELRVTQIFREAGRWRIVHRHADAQVAKQPPVAPESQPNPLDILVH